MANFMIRFLFCNVSICAAIGILLTARRFLRNHLTSRMQYNLWFLLFGLLAIPFIPIRPGSFPHVLSWLGIFENTAASHTKTPAEYTSVFYQSGTADWMNDLSRSVSQRTPSAIGRLLCIFWIVGILIMTAVMIWSALRLNMIRKSALPLQNEDVRRIYRHCLTELNITRNIPVYSTAFLKSPMIAGLFKPCIYLPLHLISDCHAVDIRYMLLHELQHYRHKDTLVNYLMNAAGILYWFNPFVWYALKEIRGDREVACDTSVLQMLEEDSYTDYGNTLINFAEKVSLTSFPFVSGIGGSMAQMQKRILNIANYRPATFRKNLRSVLSCALIAVILSGFIPALSIQASVQDRFYFNEKDKNISYIDLRTEFNGYEGSFVGYDTATNSWQIYNMEDAVTRTSPASTYKIYIALSGLKTGIITPGQSLISWDGRQNEFDTWDADQTLESAMLNSVTWYFQEIDRQIGLSSIKDYVREIGYGNQTVSGDTSSYWLNSSLKISPVEQVELLKKIYHNEFDFDPENIEALKDSITLSSTAEGSLYGKTGTLAVDGQNVSGWFVGFLEKGKDTYFFATHIQNENGAAGAAAAELTFSVLSDLKIWNR